MARSREGETLLNLLKLRPQQEMLREAREVEEDIQFYVIGKDDIICSPAKERFLCWMRSQIATSKQAEFQSIMTFPLPTANLTTIILNDLSKVLEAYNKNITAIRFKPESGTNGRDFENRFDISGIMSKKVFQTFRTKPNSLIVIEPSTGYGRDKRPDLYFVDIDKLQHIEQDEEGNVKLAVWKNDKDGTRFTACDSSNFYFIDARDKELSNAHVKTVPHALGITPARMIYPVFKDSDNRVEVDSPLADQVGSLQWFLFWTLARKVLNKSAPFPIYSHYEDPCDFVHDASGSECKNGRVYYDDPETGTPVSMDCPKCKDKKNKLIAGSTVTIRTPVDKEDVDLRNPVQVLSAEKVSIQFAKEEEERLNQQIYYNTVGRTLVPLESFSASPDQIEVIQESKKNTLMRMKSVLEDTHNFIVTCFAKVAYGDQFVSSDVNYGDNWFLKTVKQELDTFTEMKNSNMGDALLVEQRKNIIRREYSTNNDEMTRQLFLTDMEPYPTHTYAEVRALYLDGVVTGEELALKGRFGDIIKQVEKQVGNIGIFLNSQSSSNLRAKKNFIATIVVNKAQEYSQNIKVSNQNQGNNGEQQTPD